MAPTRSSRKHNIIIVYKLHYAPSLRKGVQYQITHAAAEYIHRSTSRSTHRYCIPSIYGQPVGQPHRSTKRDSVPIKIGVHRRKEQHMHRKITTTFQLSHNLNKRRTRPLDSGTRESKEGLSIYNGDTYAAVGKFLLGIV